MTEEARTPLSIGTIFALGGGGFSVEGRDSPLDDFLLSLTEVGRRLPRVAFVGTAGGDTPGYRGRFETAFAGRADTSVIDLFSRDGRSVDEMLDVDIVYVGGGNTANLLALWRLHGLDRAVVTTAERGVILAGVSAGMNCWFEGSVTDSWGPLAALPDGLGLLPGSACPHYDGDVDRRPVYQQLVAAGELPTGLAADDGCALLFRNGRLVEAVAERPSARAYRVELSPAGKVFEKPIPVRSLV